MTSLPTPPPDQVEELLADVVVRPEAEQAAAIAALCQTWPDLAGALQERFRLFQRLAGGPRPPADGAAPAPFGDYTLLRELGRGGMGVVYLASQRRGDQERLVALKLLRERYGLSPLARQRLQREGAAAFRLDHPGICQAYDLGEVDGTPFVSMRYVPGRTLAALLAEARAAGLLPELPQPTDAGSSGTSTTLLPHGDRVRGALWFCEQVARALHTAHEAGFVHRDVKPGNLMVGTDGAPVLLDFGLVLDASSSHGLTLTDQPLGTPLYMAPEQIEPRGRRPDRTTDVWALGVVLFELLAGEPPFQGTHREELFRCILSEPAPSLRRSRLAVPRDVDVVVRTALEKDPARRYRTAAAFADDLRRARLAQPIAAAPPSPWRRISLWAARNQLAAGLLVLLVGSQGVIGWLAHRASSEAAEARRAQLAAETDYREASAAIGELTEVAQYHLDDVPWMESVRRALFERALRFHERTADRAADAPAARLRALQARVQAAYLQEDLGDNAAARRLAVDALADELVQTSREPELQRQLARGRHLLGVLAEKSGDALEAERHFAAAASAMQTVLDGPSAMPADRQIAAHAHLARALLLEGQAGRRADTLAAIDATLALTDPAQPQLALDRAAAQRLRARLARLDGDEPRAISELLVCCATLRSLLAAHPHERDARNQLGNTLVALGLAQKGLRQFAAALQSYREAKAVHEDLVAAFPFVVAYRGSLANVCNNLAVLQRQTGATEEAAASLARAIEVAGQVLRDEPDNRETRHLLAGCAHNLANQVRDQDPDRALALFRDSFDQAEQLLATAPDDRRSLDIAGRAANSLGAMLARQQRFTEAMAVFGAARKHTTRLLDGHGTVKQAGRNAALLHYNAGSLACEMGDLPLALEHLQLGVRFAETLVAESPQDPTTHALLQNQRLRQAMVQELADPARATPLYAAAVDAAEALPRALREQVTQDPLARFDRGALHRGLAACRLREGDDAAARHHLERAAAELPPPTGLASQVEYLLLARDQAILALRAGGPASAELAELTSQAAGVAERLGQSPLQRQRTVASTTFAIATLPPARLTTLRAAMQAVLPE